MVDSALEERIRLSVVEGLTRVIASNPKLSRFSDIKVNSDPRVSGHSRVFHAVATDPVTEQCRYLAVKKYHHPDVPDAENEDFDLAFVRAHDPGTLLVTEATNYEWLSRRVTMVNEKGKEVPSYLAPNYSGSDSLSKILVTRHMDGDLLHNLIKNALEVDFPALFISGLKDVARLNGLSNAPENLARYVIDPSEMRVKAALQASREKEVLKANFARIYHILSGDAATGQPFSMQDVNRKLGIASNSLEGLTQDVHEKLRAIEEPVRIMHHDTNGKNIIVRPPEKGFANRFIDLESLGPGPRMTDIASYCIILSKGSNYVISSDQFFDYLTMYLTYESAWRDRDPEKIKRLNSLADPRDFSIESGMGREEYVTAASEFFLRAILKTMKLSGSAAREMQFANDREQVVINPPETWSKDMNGLYHMVEHGLMPLIGVSDKAPEFRAAFYAIGNAANRLGYDINPDTLKVIGSGNHPGARFLISMPGSPVSNGNGGSGSSA
jgi:hypothetical protein